MTLLKRAEKKRGRFLNPVPTEMAGLSLALKVLPKMIFSKEERMPASPVGPFATDASIYLAPPKSGLRVTWFGHSSMLMEIDGYRVLVDPVWEERASPVQWSGPKRFFPPTMTLDDLPPLDAVLISHDHYDHLGRHTVRKLVNGSAAEKAQWITSLGVGRRLRRFGVPGGRVHELDWTESTMVGGGLKLTAWPARHFSGRGVLDRFKTLWSSFVIEGPQHRVYFGADSGWWDGFAEIATQYERFDLIMLEIGAFDVLWEAIHLGPDNAVRAHAAMGGPSKAGLLMPIHWGLFNLALHAWRQPMQQLEASATAGDVPLWSPQPGLPTEVGGPVVSDWWRSDRKS